MQLIPEQSGFFVETDHHDTVPGTGSRRPLSMAWVTDELIEETRRVWTPLYGREISEDEAVEMLMNVKQLAEVLLDIAQRRRAT